MLCGSSGCLQVGMEYYVVLGPRLASLAGTGKSGLDLTDYP